MADPKLTPVDFDPFSGGEASAGPALTPVDFDPFAERPQPEQRDFGAAMRAFTEPDRMILTPILRGAADVAGLPSALMGMAGAAGSWVGQKLRGDRPSAPVTGVGADIVEATAPEAALPTSEGVQRMLGVAPGGPLEYQPETAVGRIAQEAARGAVGGALTGGAVMAPAAGYSALSSGAAQAVEEVAPGATLVKTAAALMAPAAAAGARALMAPSGTRALARDFQEMPPERQRQFMSRAEQMQQQSRETGVPLTLGELTNESGLLRSERLVSESPAGQAMAQQFYEQRPEAVNRAITQQAEVIQPRGLTDAPEDISRRIEDVATKRIRASQEARSEAVKPFYEEAASVPLPQDQIVRLIELGDQLKANKGPLVKANIDKILEDIIGNPTVGSVDSIRQTANKSLAKGQSLIGTDNVDKEAYSAIKPLLREARSALESTSDAYATGIGLYQRMSPAVELDEQLLSRLSRDKLFAASDDPVSAVEQQIKQVIDPAKTSPQRVREIVGKVAELDPQAPRDLFRAYLEQVQDKAGRSTQRYAPGEAPMIGAKFASEMFRSDRGKANVNSYLETSGLKPKEIQGFNRFVDVLQRTGRTLPEGSPSIQKMEGMAQLGRSVANPKGAVAQYIRDRAIRLNARQLAEIVYAPDNLERFKALLEAPTRRGREVIVAEILAATRLSEEE